MGTKASVALRSAAVTIQVASSTKDTMTEGAGDSSTIGTLMKSTAFSDHATATWPLAAYEKVNVPHMQLLRACRRRPISTCA